MFDRTASPSNGSDAIHAKKSDPSKPWVKDALPVRIARSALAPNVPRADLYVNASSHSLLIE